MKGWGSAMVPPFRGNTGYIYSMTSFKTLVMVIELNNIRLTKWSLVLVNKLKCPLMATLIKVSYFQ